MFGYMNQFVEIHLFATLKAFSPPNADHYPIETGMTIRQLISELHIPEKEAKLVFINGTKADLDSVLKHNDRIGIFPPVGGG